MARIHHRLKLTKEAGLEVPRLEVLLQKTKCLDEKSDHCIFLGPFIPSIQKTFMGQGYLSGQEIAFLFIPCGHSIIAILKKPPCFVPGPLDQPTQRRGPMALEVS